MLIFKTGVMASKLRKGQELTRKQIVSLGAAISAENMAAIAEGYMDISDETIKNLQYENKGQAEAFNREVIKLWKNQNPENQAQVNIISLRIFHQTVYVFMFNFLLDTCN